MQYDLVTIPMAMMVRNSMGDLQKFSGFGDGKANKITFPNGFFQDLLPLIEDLDELRITLFYFWFQNQQEKKTVCFRAADWLENKRFIALFGNDRSRIESSLEKAISQGIFLMAENSQSCAGERIYFLNSPRGRATFQALTEGKIKFEDLDTTSVISNSEKPNIYKLYEENIGAITPIMAEILKDDEAHYPDYWITEAITIAVKQNARNWKYVQAILESWQKEGRDAKERKDGKSGSYDPKDPNRYRRSWLGEND